MSGALTQEPRFPTVLAEFCQVNVMVVSLAQGSGEVSRKQTETHADQFLAAQSSMVDAGVLVIKDSEDRVTVERRI